MRFNSSLVKFVMSSALLLAVVAAPAAAINVNGASHYGPDPGFLSCLDGTSNCQSFDLADPTVVSFNSLNYDVFQFVTNDGNGVVSLFNIVDLGSLGPDATFTLPPAFFPPTLTAALGCGGQSDPFDGSFSPSDSSFPANPVNGICTPGSTAPVITLNADGSFTTGANFSISNLVLDAPVGAPASTPEPGTLTLLGVGLLAVGRKFRRAL
jgi:hypothetical protein